MSTEQMSHAEGSSLPTGAGAPLDILQTCSSPSLTAPSRVTDAITKCAAPASTTADPAGDVKEGRTRSIRPPKTSTPVPWVRERTESEAAVRTVGSRKLPMFRFPPQHVSDTRSIVVLVEDHPPKYDAYTRP
ncbi:hypothetical protein BKA93DRAFT_444014 [Sparassis latifolia]